jgi:DNA-binding MarR family transcriptional regulator
MSCKEPPSQKELAAAFEVTPAAIAMSLKKLEAKGLIERVVAMEDNRVNLISISEEGKAVMERNRALFESTDAAMLEGVNDEEIAMVSAILDKFIDNLIRIGAEDEIPAFCKAEKLRKGQ